MKIRFSYETKSRGVMHMLRHSDDQASKEKIVACEKEDLHLKVKYVLFAVT